MKNTLQLQGISRRAFVLGTLIPLFSACATETRTTISTKNLGRAQTESPNVISENPIESPHPWNGVQTKLPGEGRYIAWTLDDGKNPKVVRAYTEFAARTGIRMTFFINGSYNSFEQNLDVLLPLVKSGQIQIGNHTWSHPELTELSDAKITEELNKNDEEIVRLFGISSKPYYRPPYGHYNQHVMDVAAAAGYDRIVMWQGHLGDEAPIATDEIYRLALENAQAQRIMIGHLNYENIISVLDRIKDLLDERELTTVTLRDYYED